MVLQMRSAASMRYPIDGYAARHSAVDGGASGLTVSVVSAFASEIGTWTYTPSPISTVYVSPAPAPRQRMPYPPDDRIIAVGKPSYTSARCGAPGLADWAWSACIIDETSRR